MHSVTHWGTLNVSADILLARTAEEHHLSPVGGRYRIAFATPAVTKDAAHPAAEIFGMDRLLMFLHRWPGDVEPRWATVRSQLPMAWIP